MMRWSAYLQRVGSAGGAFTGGHRRLWPMQQGLRTLQSGMPAVASSTPGRTVRAAVWQGCAEAGNVEANLQRVAGVVSKAQAQGVELVLFAELFACGYDCDAAQLRASARAQESEAMDFVGRLARESGVCVALPYAEVELPASGGSRDAAPIYNACAVFDSTGRLALNYRKVNLWGPWEQASFGPGSPEQLRCADIKLASGGSVRCGVMICYDVEFPEPARCLAMQGAELLLVPTALGAGDVELTTPMKVVPTRALENHVFIMYSNLEGAAACGEAQNVPSFCGRSAVVAPDGEDLARADAFTGGQLLVSDLSLDGYASSVARNPYLSDRFRRMQAGHYAPLGLLPGGDAPLGVQRELALAAAAEATSSAEKPADDAGASERVRVQRFVEGLPSRDFAYGGENACQFIRLYLPDEDHRWLRRQPGNSTLGEPPSGTGGLPVLFLVHGGFWKSKWSCENTQTTSLVPDFLQRGFAVALVEYRRREMPGGTWPGPEEDVAAALQHLQVLSKTEPLDLSRVVVLGHSAGGQLAVAACSRAAGLQAQSAVRPCLCVSVGSVPDMLPGYEAKLSDEGDAIEQYMGFHPDSEEHRRSYEGASLSSRLPLGVPTLLVSGSEDIDVPPRLLRDFHERCVVAAPPGAPVELLEIYGADHYNLITAGHKMWRQVARRMTVMLQEVCSWQLPPHAEDYDVTEERGFLPSPDPVQDGAANLPPGFPPAEMEYLQAWEDCVRELPSHLNAGVVRQRIALLPEPRVGKSGDLAPWQVLLLGDEARAERALLLLSWLGHAWVWGEAKVAKELPSNIAVPWTEVARILGRPAILTYYSFNAFNWRRLDPKGHIELGNICRLNNFLGGQDEEWFSTVHVAIEALAGKGLTAAVAAQRVVARGPDGPGRDELSAWHGHLADALEDVADTVESMVSTLGRMKERCDPYIYYMRVRVFMKGWTADELGGAGMEYCGVPAPEGQDGSSWRREYFFGETGAQSSVVPALDAALGLAMSDDPLLPYLQAMRSYMPPKHSDFVSRLERGPALRAVVLEASKTQSGQFSSDGAERLVKAYNRCVQGLVTFRGVHFELAFSFVRKWDERKDEEILGTGGTPFMSYLKKHRGATRDLRVEVSEEGAAT